MRKTMTIMKNVPYEKKYGIARLKKHIGPVWWSGQWSEEERKIINDIFNKYGDVKKTSDELNKMKIHLYNLEKRKYGNLSRVLKSRSLYTIAECLYSKNDVKIALKQAKEYKNNIFKEKTQQRNKGWNKAKQAVLKNDNNVCAVCGVGDNLEVHHIIPLKEVKTHDIENLITLCRKCHDYISNDKLWMIGSWIKYNPQKIWNDIVLTYLKILEERGFFVTIEMDVSTSAWSGSVSNNWIISKTPMKIRRCYNTRMRELS